MVRFNWHFYALSFLFISSAIFLVHFIPQEFQIYIKIFGFLVAVSTSVSLFVSYYVYDYSNFYKFHWLMSRPAKGNVFVNVNAGFDDTSQALKMLFNPSKFIALDFYNANKHTEVSIKRARKAYPSNPNTISVSTVLLPLANKSVDNLFVIFSAHEIRDEHERVSFFKELNRVIKPTGKIFITEHLRNLPNFLAFNIGFFHFYTKSAWLKTFQLAQLEIENEIPYTPFISTFLLKPYGNTI